MSLLELSKDNDLDPGSMFNMGLLDLLEGHYKKYEGLSTGRSKKNAQIKINLKEITSAF